MVLAADRHPDIVRNGRRSRGPSPNGHAGAGGGGTPDTSSDDDNSIKRNGKSKAKQSEYEEKIRVGRDYQAVCPPLVPEPERKPEILNDRALLVWSPTKDIPESKLEDYITVAKERYGYNGEQALGMLFWHKHDLERAVSDLANFTPFPDEWTVEDKVLFEQAFQFHGKSFHRIRQMLPDKTIASLVKYYYSWKKTRHRQSVMDRAEKIKASKDGSDNGSENGSNEDSENEEKVQQNKQSISALKRKNSDSSEELRPNDSGNRINSRWTNEEILLAVQGVRKFGKDFQAIAEAIGTKNEAHVRTFYVNYRRRYNLDQKLKEFEAEKEAQKQDDEKKKEPSPQLEEQPIATESAETNNEISTSAAVAVAAVRKLSQESTPSTTTTPAKENIIMEIDLDSDHGDTPPTKKRLLSTPTPEVVQVQVTKASAVV